MGSALITEIEFATLTGIFMIENSIGSVRTNIWIIIRDFGLLDQKCLISKGPFKYYVSKEVGGWGQKMAIHTDLQYYLCWLKWVGGPKKAKKHAVTQYLNGP